MNAATAPDNHPRPRSMSDLTPTDTPHPTHDPLCMPGLKHEDATGCVWCTMIRMARADEREKVRAFLALRKEPAYEPPTEA